MQVAGHSHVQVESIYGKGSFESRSQAEPIQASTVCNIHESPWLMIPIPAALVCAKTCDTVAEDARNICQSPFHWRYSRQVRYIHAVLKQTFQRKFFPARLQTCWYVCLTDETDLSRHIHSSLEEEHILER